MKPILMFEDRMGRWWPLRANRPADEPVIDWAARVGKEHRWALVKATNAAHARRVIAGHAHRSFGYIIARSAQ